MSYLSTAPIDAGALVVLALGHRSRLTTADIPDTLLLLPPETSRASNSLDDIAEHVHELGAMAVIA